MDKLPMIVSASQASNFKTGWQEKLLGGGTVATPGGLEILEADQINKLLASGGTVIFRSRKMSSSAFLETLR